MGNGFEKSFLNYHFMDYILNKEVAEFLSQPWFIKSDLYTRVQPVQETENSRIITLFQEYYY